MVEVAASHDEEKGTFRFAHPSEKVKLASNKLRIFVSRKMYKIKKKLIHTCVHYTRSLRSVAISTFVLLLKCPFILPCRFDLVEYSRTARQEDMGLCNVQDIPLKFCCRNKSHLCDSPFNMFFSSVHWACISWKTLCPSTAWVGMAKNSEIFNSSGWHGNFFYFKFATYLGHAWCV